MRKKEFANQQPTQNLIGRGRRGIYIRVHRKGNEVRSRHQTSLYPLWQMLLQLGIPN